MKAVRAVVLFMCISFIHAKVWRLNCNQKRLFVDGHNSRRMQIARGEVNAQPAASKMTALVWDKELATKAAKWASKNKFQHNPDRTIPSKRFTTGENLFYFSTTDQNYQFSLDEALRSWFEEHKDYEYKAISMDDFNSSTMIGHYTQMVWSKTTYVGCAVSQYPDGEYTTFLVVCNYGRAGNMIGEKPYEAGYPSNKLVCGTRDCIRRYGESC